MSIITDNNFFRVCRICLENDSSVHIFDSKEELSNKIILCAAVQLSRDDGLPSKVCSDCCCRVEQAVALRKLCESSDVRLRIYQTLKLNKEGVNELDCTTVNNGHNEVDLPIKPEDEALHHLNNISTNSEAAPTWTNSITEFNANQNVMNRLEHENLVGSENDSNEIIKPEYEDSFNSPVNKQSTLDNYSNPLTSPLSAKSPQRRRDPKRQMTAEGDFECEYCKKRFKKPSNLNAHIRIHKSARKHKCQQQGCVRAFLNNKDLVNHMRIHTKERPYECEICGQAFSQVGHLRKHVTVHEGAPVDLIKPFICKICGKGFAIKPYLRLHERSHSDQRPHVCSVCNKGFLFSGDLTKHQRIHTGEKPYICDVCGKAFTQSGTMKAHRKTLHKDVEWTAPLNPRFSRVRKPQQRVQHNILENDVNQHNQVIPQQNCNISSSNIITQNQIIEVENQNMSLQECQNITDQNLSIQNQNISLQNHNITILNNDQNELLNQNQGFILQNIVTQNHHSQNMFCSVQNHETQPSQDVYLPHIISTNRNHHSLSRDALIPLLPPYISSNITYLHS